MRRSNRQIETAQAAEPPHIELRYVNGPLDGTTQLMPRGMMPRTPIRVKYHTSRALHWYMSVGPWTGKAVLHLFHRGVAGSRVAS